MSLVLNNKIVYISKHFSAVRIPQIGTASLGHCLLYHQQCCVISSLNAKHKLKHWLHQCLLKFQTRKSHHLYSPCFYYKEIKKIFGLDFSLMPNEDLLFLCRFSSELFFSPIGCILLLQNFKLTMLLLSNVCNSYMVSCYCTLPFNIMQWC